MSIGKIEELFANRPKADALVLPFWSKEKKAEKAFVNGNFPPLGPIEMGDFHGKEGEVNCLYLQGEKEPRFFLMGLGEKEKFTSESLRSSCAAAVMACRKKKITRVNFLLPEVAREKEDFFRAFCEGVLLSNYSFEKRKGEKEKKEAQSLLTSFTLVGAKKSYEKILAKAEIIASSVYLSRDLVNDNADEVTPQKLAEVARLLGKLSKKLEVEVWDKARIEKEGLCLLLAVNRASSLDPAFLIVRYQGKPNDPRKVLLVGKGITYDTGGLSLKPSESMDTMKTDMAGASAVLGTLRSCAELSLEVNVVAMIPATENAIGPKSYKPGDVYPSFAKKTIEVVNTDAEGRLILADALAYGIKAERPSEIIDIATLTGAIIIALGEEIAGLFSNNDELSSTLVKASEKTGEKVWRMPLFPEYRKLLKSEIADIKNVGGKKGSPITAALFLEEFVEKIPWAHLDIGGTAYYAKPKSYYPTSATGMGVRLLLEFLELRFGSDEK